MIDAVLWWSGVLAWSVAMVLFVLLGGTIALDFALKRLHLKREFLLWCFERAKARGRKTEAEG